MPFQYEGYKSLLIVFVLKGTLTSRLLDPYLNSKKGVQAVFLSACLGRRDLGDSEKVPENIIGSIENNDYQGLRNNVSYAQSIVNGT